MTADALHQRTELPAAFRYLEAACPRASWATPGLHPTARHWLDIHDWFRAQMAGAVELGAGWRGGRSDAGQYRAAMAPRLQHLLNNLHHHHEIESAHYFPRLGAAEPKAAAAFALLDRDHAAVDARLSAVAQAGTALIRSGPDADDLKRSAEALADEVERSSALIARHLWDEEEIVIPVLVLRGDGV